MVDIKRILSSAGIKYVSAPHDRVRHGWIGVDCPRCSPNYGKFRLGFQLNTLRAHCWVCGAFYPPAIIAQLLRISLPAAHELVGKPDRRKPAERKLDVGTLQLPVGIGPLLPAHINYLRNDRHLDPSEIVRLWGVRGIDQTGGHLKWRLFIPVCDEYGRMVSWITRTISKDNPKRYFAARPEQEEVHHKHLLYGAQHCRHTIVIQEGAIDAWTIGPGAVATLGVGYTAQQKALMGQYPRRIVCFDNEPEAQARADALCNDLSALPGTTDNVCWETGKDTNSVETVELDEFRRKFFPELYLESAA